MRLCETGSTNKYANNISRSQENKKLISAVQSQLSKYLGLVNLHA